MAPCPSDVSAAPFHLVSSTTDALLFDKFVLAVAFVHGLDGKIPLFPHILFLGYLLPWGFGYEIVGFFVYERQDMALDFFLCETVSVFEGMRHLCGLIACFYLSFMLTLVEKRQSGVA